MIVDCAWRSRRTIVLDESAEIVGELPRCVDRLWGGREPNACRYQIGDLIAFVDDRVARVGVVCALPPSPAEARRVGWTTRGDDVYRVGVVELNDELAYERVPDALLIPVPQHWVDDAHYASLKTRLAASRGTTGPVMRNWRVAASVTKFDAETHVLVENGAIDPAEGALTLGGGGRTTEFRNGVVLPKGVLVRGHVRGPLTCGALHEIVSWWAPRAVPTTLRVSHKGFTDVPGLPFTIAIGDGPDFEGMFELRAADDSEGRPEILIDVRCRGDEGEDDELEATCESDAVALEDAGLEVDDDPRTCRSAVIVLGDESREPAPGSRTPFLTKRGVSKEIKRRIRIDKRSVTLAPVAERADQLRVAATTIGGKRAEGTISIALSLHGEGGVETCCVMRVEVGADEVQGALEEPSER
ncbi:MAG: hypothetical protein ACHREM_07765 [Polyangiales bacterium]